MKNIRLSIYVLILTSILGMVSSCEESSKQSDNREIKQPDNTRFSLLDKETTGIDFVNKIENKKDFNIFTYRNFYNGGGVAIGDINNDGLPDIYLTSNFGKNKLYLNKGNLKFEDISTSSHAEGNRAWSTGVVMVDLNADGFLDIYVCNAGNIKGDNQKNELFINNGDLTFTEKAEDYNLADSGFTTHAAFFDYDNDGDLDAYILNNSFIPVNSLNFSNKRELRAKDWDVPEVLKGGGDKLLRNDNGKFVDVSENAGIYGSLIGFGLGVTVGDVNGDFFPDIYVSNDFYERDYLYINQKNGTFKEEVEDWTAHTSLASMGADMQDINNDGKPDIYVTDMLPENDARLKNTTQFESYDVYQRKLNLDFHHQFMQNSLQLNTGNNGFSEIANYGGVSKTDWSWGALLFDMDNDGYKDIYVCNGIYHDLTNQDFIDFFANDIIQKMMISGKMEEKDSIINKMPSNPIPNYAFRNNQDLTFTDRTDDWGFNIPSFSNGAAYGDLDNDGDLDLIVNNVNQQAFIFRNNTQETDPKNYLKINFKGEGNNTFGVGAIAELYIEDQIIRQELIPTRGFQSSTEYTLTVGLGDTEEVDSIAVHWPDQTQQTLKRVKVNRTITFDQKDAKSTPKLQSKGKKPLLREVAETMERHKEDVHVDFNYEGLISKMLSREGPAMAVGDVNKDGNEDVFVGGGKGQPGKVYTQTGQGKLRELKQGIFQADASMEDTAAAFFDADGDGDLDLLVSTGGNDPDDNANYNNRLYFNDGRGEFTEKSLLPTTQQNVSTIAVADFDRDGDMDVFIGSRSVPGIYGINPKHLLLENMGDATFKDVTESKAYDIQDVGMITSAKWADVDGDKKEDLVVVGDWMAPMVFKNNGKRLHLEKTSLDSLTGWWNTVEIADVDGDGDLDLILGNQGDNMPYGASAEKPMKLFVNDFDNNGTIEQITTRNINGKDVPIPLKAELTSQISSLKKQSLRNSEYAKKSIDDLFDADVLRRSIVKSAVESKSVIALNNGNNQFTVLALPAQVQFSCVCGISCSDVDKDGNMDLLLGGNNYGFKPQFSQLDSNYGSVLLGDGKGGFNWVPYSASGFFVKGEVKHIRRLYNKNGKDIFIAVRNNDAPKIFAINE
ncbi:VCBS repeat-containing protein [Flavobacteriaceae bacterium F89]|uniref:VCBS repeat-containing protein n=1 Tax=Cerina litoralis TaxID=2874477 RepID=A0AAE3EZR3_9FLAO|nr:VCBS repeat-containing protein [Cerina litoralis]MCG2462746.1 VCBS repeat-containing protein [Cerina litoralis]